MELIKQTKLCKDCNQEKPLSEFYFQKKQSKMKGDYIYYNPECKECTKKRTWGWQIDNRKRRSKLQMNFAKTPKGKEIQDKAHKNYRDKGKLIEWQHNNPEKLKGYAEKRSNKTHEINTNEWENCKNYFNYRCAYCGLAIEEHFVQYNRNVINGNFHRDHVDHNGENDLSNCVPSCKSCNISKGEYELESWYNDTNPNFTKERLNKIYEWLAKDYLIFIDID